jgi:hypothetical protein
MIKFYHKQAQRVRESVRDHCRRIDDWRDEGEENIISAKRKKIIFDSSRDVSGEQKDYIAILNHGAIRGLVE